jgi:hypothetical protein
MPVPVSRVLLRLRLLRELVGKEFLSTENMEFEVLMRIEDVVGEKPYVRGYYSVPEYGVTVFEVVGGDMVFRVFYVVDVGRIRVVWVDVSGYH